MKRLLFIAAILATFVTISSCIKEDNPSISVTGVIVSPESLEMEIGNQKALTATITPKDATNKGVKFASSKESVVTVTQDGIVEAVAAGSAIVTVTTEDGNYKSHCTVTVSEKVIHVTGIALNKTSLSLTEGDEFTLIPTITPENAADKSVNWTSSNEAVATVSSEGVVKALKAGTATVTATTKDQQKTATCSVVVSEGIGAVTGEASHISCRSAEISGKANISGSTSVDLSFGVLYSTSSGVLIGTATKIEAKTFDSEYNFTVNTEALEPETTYYYRSYIIQNSEVSYGEVKSFKTLVVSSMIKTEEATDIHSKEATLNAFMDLKDCKYEALDYGFEVTPEGGSAHTVKASNHSGQAFSAKDKTLVNKTNYSCIAYVILDGRTYKGEAKTFTTKSIQASITAESSNVSYYTATISGALTVSSEGTFTKSATLYYSSTASTLEALKSSGMKKTLSLNQGGTYSENLTSLISNTKYNYAVVSKVDNIEFITEVKMFTTSKYPETVDLGLSVKWRGWNVGATKPEEYGTYFAWGDVVGQTWNGSSWSGGGFSTYPTYELDANGNLKPEYDAAHVNLGGSWRMPTKAEQEELINNCTSTWTSDYNGTGVAGRIFTSNKEGYTDKFIFLPAAGHGYYSFLKGAGSGGHYLSRALYFDIYVWYLYFRSDDVGTSFIGRYCGQSVRPVTE